MNLTRVVGLAGQLALGSPRSRLRFVFTAAGMAVAALFLLAGAAVLPLSEAQRDRAADRSSTLEKGEPRSAGTLLTREWSDVYLDQPLLVGEVAAIRSDAPPPPGLERLPGPGEIVVSPEVEAALRTDVTLRERYPQSIIGTVGDAGLTGPREWVLWMGADPAAFPTDYVPSSGWGAKPQDVPRLPGGLRLAVPVGLAALLLPLLALVVNAVRWGSQERDRRLAALRLTGMSATQVRILTAAEVGLASAVGAVGGGLSFVALTAALARWLPGGGAFFLDALPPAPAAVAIIVGLPVFATLTAVGALRRMIIDPLGVVRRAAVNRPGLWRLLPLIAGLALVGWLLLTNLSQSDAAVPFFLAGALIMVGLLVGAPVLCLGVAKLLLRMDRHPTMLLAARRAQASAGSAARVVGVVTLLVFAAGWFLAVLPMADAGNASSLARLEQSLKPQTMIANVERAPEPGELDLPGVTGVALLVQLELGVQGAASGGLYATAGDCAALSTVLRAPLPKCDPEVTYLTGVGEQNRLADGRPLAAYRVDSESADGLNYVELGPIRYGPAFERVPEGLEELGSLGLGIVPMSGVPTEALRAGQLLVTVSSSDPGTVERVRTAIQGLQEGGGREVRDVAAMIQQHQSVSAMYQRVTWAGLVLAFVVSTLSLAVALLDRLLEERRAVAALRAQGVTIRTLRMVLLGQTAANLLPGVLLGLACTVPVAEAFFVITDRPELTIPWTQLAATAVGCGVAALTAAALMLPALKEAIDPRLLAAD